MNITEKKGIDLRMDENQTEHNDSALCKELLPATNVI